MFRSVLKYSPSKFTIKYLLFALACFLPINIILWYISHANELTRSYFNVDYFLPVLISALLYKLPRVAKPVFIILYIVVYVIDISKIILTKFGFEGDIFSTAEDFGGANLIGVVNQLYWGNILSELKQIPNVQYNIFIVGIIVSLVIAFCIFLVNRKRSFGFLSAISSVYLFATLVFHPDAVFLLSLEIFVWMVLLSFYCAQNVRAYTSRADILVFTLMSFYFLILGGMPHTPTDDKRNYFSNFTTFVVFNFEVTERNIPSASDEIFESVKNNNVKKYDNIVLIIVESLGYLNNEDSMKNIMKVFDDPELHKNYNVNISSLNYRGHTTTAEIRELCKWQMHGLPNISNKGEFDACLPHVLKDQGFATTAIHNASKFVFYRHEWWPLFEFDNMHFIQDLSQQYKFDENCKGGGFTAICEKDVMDRVIPDVIKQHKKNFVYFLTVESHIPINERIPVTPEFRKICDETPVLKDINAICKIYDIQYNLFRHTISMAKKMAGKNNLIIIVGDHTPPFFTEDLTNKFDKSIVPMIIIKSK